MARFSAACGRWLNLFLTICAAGLWKHTSASKGEATISAMLWGQFRVSAQDPRPRPSYRAAIGAMDDLMYPYSGFAVLTAIATGGRPQIVDGCICGCINFTKKCISSICNNIRCDMNPSLDEPAVLLIIPAKMQDFPSQRNGRPFLHSRNLRRLVGLSPLAILAVPLRVAR